jgi:hypothetical protein
VNVNGVWLGAALARERLRDAALAISLLLASSCGVIYALGVVARSGGGSDGVLEVPVFGLALPLLAYLLSERLCNAQRLDRCVDSLARHGADRRAALLGVLLVSAVGTALGSALLTLAALLGARSPHAGDFGADLGVSLAIAALSGAVYAVWFGAASLFGKRGGGRRWALILDFLLGTGGSLFAAPWPRGHARNLLGGAPVLDISQSGAWLALLVIGGASVALSVARTPS